jgi:hypothetical protein
LLARKWTIFTKLTCSYNGTISIWLHFHKMSFILCYGALTNRRTVYRILKRWIIMLKGYHYDEVGFDIDGWWFSAKLTLEKVRIINISTLDVWWSTFPLKKHAQHTFWIWIWDSYQLASHTIFFCKLLEKNTGWRGMSQIMDGAIIHD